MKSLLGVAGLALTLFGGAASADALPVELCDVELDPRMSVYMVTVAGQPYRNKRYLTFDDAVKLRDFLKVDGACEKLAAPRECKLKTLGSGDYAVMRDGVNFDPYVKLTSLKQARRHARSLEQFKLCKTVP